MKRGFLNGSKAKARPLGPATVAASSTSKPATVAKQDRSLMGFQITEVDVPEMGALDPQERDNGLGSTPGTMTFTTFPINAKDDEPTTECLFIRGSKEVVMNIPGFPQPLVHPATPAFRLDTVPGKGMGAYSTRDLKTGDLILCERPLIISARGVPVPRMPNFTDEMYFQHSLNVFEKHCAIVVDRMRPEDKAAFMALANSHTKDGSGPCMGIMRTNGIGIGGLLPSKTDLPCSPNTCSHFDKPSFSYRLYAVRDIPAGEELTYPYVDAEVPTAERQKSFEPYGFVCTCPACTDPSSDARRASLEPSTPNLLLWATINRTLPIDWMIKKSLQQLVLLTTEKMQHHSRYSDATRAIMEVYICLGDTKNASKWAAKVHQQVWAGEYEPADIELLLDPANTAAYEAHPFWRMRVDPGGKAATKMLQLAAEYTAQNSQETILAGSHRMR
ncbi:hypothetical protein B0H12DRAFT_1081385 [Mycena haematopus]|nr:hypothetical protein B0H12DRAFT_1081385 [Mycena haematopus]